MYLKDSKTAREKNKYPRYYMYKELYIVRNEWASYYRVNEDMEWEEIDRRGLNEIWDLDELTEEDVLKVYPKEILVKVPLDTIKYEYGRIQDIEIESILDRSQQVQSQNVKPSKVTLYKEDNIYESEEVTASILLNELWVTGVTSEKAPGGQYGMSSVLNEEDTKKLMQLLGTDEDGLLLEMKRNFDGSDAESKFQNYCKRNGLKIATYLA